MGTDAASDECYRGAGGPGNFGARICRALRTIPRLNCWGRSSVFGPGCREIKALVLDIARWTWRDVCATCPPRRQFIAVRPYQGQDYRVATAPSVPEPTYGRPGGRKRFFTHSQGD